MLTGAPSLRAALAEAVRLGLSVRYGRRTGEWLVSRPGERVLRVNARRKDAPRRLVAILRD